jgi:hypothetical protein
LSFNNSNDWIFYLDFFEAKREDGFDMKSAHAAWGFRGVTWHVIANALDILAHHGSFFDTALHCYISNFHIGDPASEFVHARPLHCNLGSNEAFAWTNSRLLECTSSHPECRRPEGSLLPLRVINIKDRGAHESFKLRLTRCQIPDSYAALSYCWGGDQPIKTTNATLEAYTNDIPAYNLPQTLLDAVIATRKLGLSYLWIDCLCINQDDDLEKSVEIAKMPYIFEGAYVTLSAARSASAKEGFLHDLHRPDLGAECFRLPYACPNGVLGSIILSIQHKLFQSAPN